LDVKAGQSKYLKKFWSN